MALKDWSDGEVLYSADLNGNFTFTLQANKIHEIYTSTGFDTSMAGSGTDSDDYELTAISAADLVGATYLMIRVTARFYFNTATGSSAASNQLQFQTQEIGGAYADTMSNRTIFGISQSVQDDYVRDGITNMKTIEWIHTLTAGELSAGVQVKILAKSVSNHASATASLTNYQTVLQSLR